ncbi:FMN-binding protein [Aquimarina sp. MAR_2010_214]|uniref:FMN-binding protein n=1 Tax=Aquimarina sp. MAR_2010_214 TaxID=1250026 RepID=UPI000CAB7CF7|nr:FMN-binding protein [Aquimarina sp. MAR_2010_214]PKV48250.1 FMN-binding protein [Aquimarina sp. MAR_2010_214]
MLVIATVFMAFSSIETKDIPEKVIIKVKKAINDTYEVASFDMKPITVPQNIDKQTKIDFGNERLVSIKNNETIIGYAYIGETASMKNLFDYVIFFEPDLRIKKSKVLIYREDYGRQIGSQRWLKQFIGLQISDTIEYGGNIDAISGATISARSMTIATQNVLKSIAILKENTIF